MTCSPLNNEEAQDLERELRTRGCPVCDYLSQTEFEYFCSWLSSFTDDKNMQEYFAETFGVCPLHTRRLTSIGSIDGIARGYPRLLDRLADEISKHIGMFVELPERLLSLLKNSENCSVCALIREKEAVYLERLAKLLEGAEGRQKYARSQGVCVRHLSLLMTVVSSKEDSRFLLSLAARRFSELARDLRNYASKREALQRILITADEEDAYVRAVLHIVGRDVIDPLGIGTKV